MNPTDEDYEEITEGLKSLCNLCNNMSAMRDEKLINAVKEGFVREHRTLVSTATRVIGKALWEGFQEAYSTYEHTDGRLRGLFWEFLWEHRGLPSMYI